jgi:antitoxin component HigA of HigAB toxin-antitoxin module
MKWVLDTNIVSYLLRGKRHISKDIAKKLARRFKVHADLFL